MKERDYSTLEEEEVIKENYLDILGMKNKMERVQLIS